MVLAPGGVGRLLSPLRVFHQEWVDERIARFTGALTKFGRRPVAARMFRRRRRRPGRARRVLRRDRPQHEHPGLAGHLAVIVPLSFVVQMVPVSVNGFGVREATFTFYFSRLGLPIESAVVVSLVGAGLIILFSLSGAVAYIGRPHRPA